MAHQRKLIRHAILSALTGATAAGQRVESTRTEPIKPTLLPAISVYTPDEECDADDAQTSPRQLYRELSVHVVGWVKAATGDLVADAVDDIAEQIEVAMDLDRYFGEVCTDSILTSTTIEVLSDENADPLVGRIKLTYQVTYTTQPLVGEGLAEFLRTNATTQIDGATPDNAAVDLFSQRP